METNGSWKTEYYADLTTNVHPNDTGHSVIASLAETLFDTVAPVGAPEFSTVIYIAVLIIAGWMIRRKANALENE